MRAALLIRTLVISPPSSPGRKPQSNYDQAMQWVSRTIAVVIVMVGPGMLGAALDRRWHTSFCTPIGFVCGMILATAALLVLAQKFTPTARGKPLPEDEDDEQERQGEDDTLENRSRR